MQGTNSSTLPAPSNNQRSGCEEAAHESQALAQHLIAKVQHGNRQHGNRQAVWPVRTSIRHHFKLLCRRAQRYLHCVHPAACQH